MRSNNNAKGGIATMVNVNWKVVDYVINDYFILVVVSDLLGIRKIIVNAYLPPSGSEYANCKYDIMLE